LRPETETKVNQLKHILVGYDFGAGADAALAQAARLAAWNDARITLIHVIDEEAVSNMALALDQPRDVVAAQTRQTALAAMQSRLSQAGLNAKVREVVGKPLHELLAAVRAERVDLLVLGMRGDSTSERGAGMLATKLIRKTATKVLLVQPGQACPFRNVVACVDFSDTAAQAYQQALRVAARDGGRVHALHVFEPPWNQLRYRVPSAEFGGELQQRFEALLLHRLQEFVGELGGNSELCRVLGAEHHSFGIAEYVEELGADLVVLGSQGRSRLEYVLLGSTAESLLRRLHSSILTVRGKDSREILVPGGYLGANA
jgi:nucleotide-binding universal stress UspA family protein